ncbi:hypothetical protein H5410_061834 [Solanum commersonii]|uniref:AIG1-type G domain-containing protein n=1 Tax=Solanum commersonii TaxID=4109 RepID=A0A9J5W9Y1_SOLCO|nr:hypothetical protein H5410_061834 [Solanum commersonii]
MGGSSVSDDWEFIANEAQTILMIGCKEDSIRRWQILDVINTLGFDFNAESGLVVNEIGKCIDLADDGVHVVLFVLSVQNSFSKEECVAIQYFKKLFGTKLVIT